MGKKDKRDLFLIHQCVDSNIFKKIIEQETVNEVWDTLKKLYDGDEKLKKVNMQYLRKQYENLEMNDDELNVELLSKMVALTYQMKSCGEKISELHEMESVLRFLPAKFDHIHMASEESKYLS